MKSLNNSWKRSGKEMRKTRLTPVVKWVGGKRQLLGEINQLIPKKIGTYVEPFLGGWNSFI